MRIDGHKAATFMFTLTGEQVCQAVISLNLRQRVQQGAQAPHCVPAVPR